MSLVRDGLAVTNFRLAAAASPLEAIAQPKSLARFGSAGARLCIW